MNQNIQYLAYQIPKDRPVSYKLVNLDGTVETDLKFPVEGKLQRDYENPWIVYVWKPSGELHATFTFTEFIGLCVTLQKQQKVTHYNFT